MCATFTWEVQAGLHWRSEICKICPGFGHFYADSTFRRTPNRQGLFYLDVKGKKLQLDSNSEWKNLRQELYVHSTLHAWIKSEIERCCCKSKQKHGSCSPTTEHTSKLLNFKDLLSIYWAHTSLSTYILFSITRQSIYIKVFHSTVYWV